MTSSVKLRWCLEPLFSWARELRRNFENGGQETKDVCGAHDKVVTTALFRILNIKYQHGFRTN